MNLIGKFRWKKSKILLVFSLIAALISVQSLQIVANASQGDSIPDFSNPTVIAGDSDSLYQAVQNASNGDVIGINGTIEVNAGISALGNSDKTLYLVRMNESACLRITGQLELTNLIIDGRSLNTSLPMIYVGDQGNCYLSSCTIQNCINQDNGGAIYCKGHVGVNNSFLKNNQAKNGGHIYLAAGSASLYQSEASGGIASEAGGAIYNKAFTSPFQIMDSKLHSNTSGIIAGGICNFSTLKIIRSAIYGNSSPNASDISNSQYSSLEMPELNELMETYQAAGIIPTEWVSDVSADIEWQISRDYDLTNEKAMMKLTYQTIGNSDDTGDNDNPDEGNTEDSGNTDDSGNSGDTGNTDDSGNSSDTGNTDDSGNSGDSGNTDDSGNSGGSGNTDDSGNSGDGGNTDDSGNSGDGGNTDDSGNDDNTDDNGNSSDTGNSDDSENSGDTGNTDDSGNAGDSNGSDNPDSGNSGDNNNSDTGDNGNTEDSGNSGDTGNTGDNGNQDTGDKPDTGDSSNSDNSGNTDDNKKDDNDNQGNSSDTGDKNNNETSNSNNTTNTQGDTSTTSTANNITTTDDRSDNSKSDSHNSTTSNTTNNYYDRSAADGSNNKRTSDSSSGSSTVNSTTNYYSTATPNTTANMQENTVSGSTASNQNIQLPDNIKLNLTNVDVVYEMVNGRSNIEISTNQTSSVEPTSTQTVQQEQIPMTTALASAPVSTAKEVKQSSGINWYEIIKLILLGAIIILVIPKGRKISVNKED